MAAARVVVVVEGNPSGLVLMVRVVVVVVGQ